MKCSHKYTFVPPSNFHITVMPLVVDQPRELPFWSPKIPLDAPLYQIDQIITNDLKDMALDNGAKEGEPLRIHNKGKRESATILDITIIPNVSIDASIPSINLSIYLSISLSICIYLSVVFMYCSLSIN